MRGMAIILMIFYHFVWDVSYFGLYIADWPGGVPLSGPSAHFDGGVYSPWLRFALRLSTNRDKGSVTPICCLF